MHTTGTNYFNDERFAAVWEWGAKLKKNAHVPAPKLCLPVSVRMMLSRRVVSVNIGLNVFEQLDADVI